MDTIDLAQFVEFVPAFRPAQCQVDRPGRRGYQFGKVLGSLRIKHTREHVLLLEFLDGGIEPFAPRDLNPVVADAAVSAESCPILA